MSARLEDLDAVLTPAEVSVVMKIHRQNVYNLIAAGKLRATNIGRGKASWRIMREDLIAYLRGDVEQGRAA